MVASGNVICVKANAMFKKLADFEKQPCYDGIQVVLGFGDQYDLSIISHKFSYGGKNGKYEIAVIDKTSCEQVNLPGITEEHDTVKGWLSESDVDGIIKKLHFITAQSPVQI